MRDDRPEVEAGLADPVAQGGPVERDPLPPVDLGLAVERQVVSELGDDDLGDQRLGGQAARLIPLATRRRARLRAEGIVELAG